MLRIFSFLRKTPV